MITKCLLICEIDKEDLWLGEDSVCIDLPPDKCSYYKDAIQYVLANYKDEILQVILNKQTLNDLTSQDIDISDVVVGNVGYYGCCLNIDFTVGEDEYTVRRKLEFITRIY